MEINGKTKPRKGGREEEKEKDNNVITSRRKQAILPLTLRKPSKNLQMAPTKMADNITNRMRKFGETKMECMVKILEWKNKNNYLTWGAEIKLYMKYVDGH